MDLFKYPRTPHIRGSRLQKGDEDLEVVRSADLVGKHLVIEEKVDGANSGISFDDAGRLYLQSRGHYLMGGPRETQFTLFKQWAAARAEDLLAVLGERYVAYGEWLYSKHTVFYDQLPHYWMEFDVLDRARSKAGDPWFLDTPGRAALLEGLAYDQVRVIWSGVWTREMRFEDFIAPSAFKSARWRDRLASQVESLGQDLALIFKHTDPLDDMEGLYVKWEEEGRVRGRYKFVRKDFVSLLVDNATHHLNLPITPNGLAEGVDLFG